MHKRVLALSVAIWLKQQFLMANVHWKGWNHSLPQKAVTQRCRTFWGRSVTISPPECLCFIHSPHLHTELFSTCCLKPSTHMWVCDSQDAFREEKSATSSSVLALFNLSGDSLFSDKWSELVLVQRQQCALSITNHLTEKRSGSRERSGKNGGGLCEIDRSYLSALQFSESVSLTLFHLLLTPFHSLLPQSDLWDLKVYYYSDQISEMGLEN